MAQKLFVQVSKSKDGTWNVGFIPNVQVIARLKTEDAPKTDGTFYRIGEGATKDEALAAAIKFAETDPCCIAHRVIDLIPVPGVSQGTPTAKMGVGMGPGYVSPALLPKEAAPPVNPVFKSGEVAGVKKVPVAQRPTAPVSDTPARISSGKFPGVRPVHSANVIKPTLIG